ncbi:A/G-specific adenine glycosylase [Thalassobacillus sp. CUG 92003]|uniref:A/G-specific adenine glycosylase n=1 Tax=Thalassobacillus sp. CUG 92003 TaxID=2736641 RepID=UPI0015E6A5CD|nr:A/G-specific adenine glycosylase [Thalassobacillus sp. CUG 92003]
MKNKEAHIHTMIDQFDRSQFRQDLIDWFYAEQRILPWRENQDPYRVWVSEIMLQQTQVDTVIPYFHRFMEKFPTLEALASADQQDVLKAWEGLGYYSRARNLQTAVQEVVAHYDGKVPDDPRHLGNLKGVGPYTKGAILSIAYDRPEPAVDGNVMRVLSRLLLIDEDIAKPAVKKMFESLVRELISTDDPSAFNQGLMELGAMVCTPKTPACMLCPVQHHCRAFAEGMETELPVKKKQKKQKRIPYISLLIKDKQGNVLIEKRPEEGLLANLWQFPMVPLLDVDKHHLNNWFYGEYGLHIKTGEQIEHINHTFSHIIWEMDVLDARVMGGALDKQHAWFVSPDSLHDYPFPVSHQKILKHI